MGENKKKIVIIGANDFQNPLIIRAKEKGYETHVFAWKSGAKEKGYETHVFAWKSGDIGEKTADVFYPISIVEKEKILEKCKEISPVGVISIGSDLASITVNYLADRLNLVGNSMESTMLSTNKHAMRVAFELAEIPSPRSVQIVEGETVNVEKFQFPLIVKPTDRSGSRGIFKVQCVEELDQAVENAINESFEKKVLIEEFAEGTEYSVEFISYNGEHHFLALTQKFTTGSPRFVETGHIEPAEVSLELKMKIIDVVKKALDVLMIKNGASHSELKVDEQGNIKIIEIGGRMGGDCIGSDLVKLSTGVDFVDLVIDVACGQKISLKKVENEGYAFIKFAFSAEEIRLLELERIAKEYSDCVVRYYLNEIEEICEVTDSSKRCGYYIFSSKEKERIDKIIDLIYGKKV